MLGRSTLPEMTKTPYYRRPESYSTSSSTKRKANDISDNIPDILNWPQKTSTSPSKNSVDSEKQLKAARDRLAIAENRRLELAVALENAMYSKKVVSPCNSPAL